MFFCFAFQFLSKFVDSVTENLKIYFGDKVRSDCQDYKRYYEYYNLTETEYGWQLYADETKKEMPEGSATKRRVASLRTWLSSTKAIALKRTKPAGCTPRVLGADKLFTALRQARKPFKRAYFVVYLRPRFVRSADYLVGTEQEITGINAAITSRSSTRTAKLRARLL